MFALYFKNIPLLSVFLVKSLYEMKSRAVRGFQMTWPVSIADATALKEYLCTCDCCVCDFKNSLSSWYKYLVDFVLLILSC